MVRSMPLRYCDTTTAADGNVDDDVHAKRDKTIVTISISSSV